MPFSPSKLLTKIAQNTRIWRQTEGDVVSRCVFTSFTASPAQCGPAAKLPGQGSDIACSTVRLSPRTGLPTSGPREAAAQHIHCLSPPTLTNKMDLLTTGPLQTHLQHRWCWRDGESGQAVEDSTAAGLTAPQLNPRCRQGSSLTTPACCIQPYNH